MSRFAVFSVLTAITLAWPSLAAAQSRPAADPDAIRVTCFNIRYLNTVDGDNIWAHRRELLFATLTAAEPDLIGLQEVVHAQVEELRAKLTAYEFVGVGRGDGKQKGEYSPVFFKRDRFEKLDEGHLWLSPTPDVPGSKGWDAALPRLASWVKLRDKQNDGRELLYVNTHWDHKGSVARAESAKVIRKLLADRAANLPAIVTGDFNCWEEHEPYATLLRPENDAPPKLIDSYRAVHPQRADDEATFHGFNGRRTGKRIDFILHTPQWQTIAASIDYANKDGRYPSDHYPVHAVLKWKPQDEAKRAAQ